MVSVRLKISSRTEDPSRLPFSLVPRAPLLSSRAPPPPELCRDRASIAPESCPPPVLRWRRDSLREAQSARRVPVEPKEPEGGRTRPRSLVMRHRPLAARCLRRSIRAAREATSRPHRPRSG